MSKGKLVTRNIKELNERLYVRMQLNQDWVLHLAEMLEAGEKLPPIVINTDGTIVDGRQRKEAHELCRRTEIECEMLEFDSDEEMISYGYKANCGGSLPPTTADTEHTVMLLLDRKVPKRDISDMMGLPPSVARKYIATVQARINRAKLVRAAVSVTDDNLTVDAAAAKFEIEPERLKEFMGSKTKRKRTAIAELITQCTVLFKSHGQKVKNVFQDAYDQLADGEVTPKQVAEIIAKVRSLQRLASKQTTNWEKRLRAAANGKD